MHQHGFIQQVLEIVEHQQDLPVSQSIHERLLQIACRRQLDSQAACQFGQQIIDRV